MALIDDSPIVLDSESEVRKLQELVKKLQLENHTLLKRNGSSNGLCAELSGDVENLLTTPIVDNNFNQSTDSDILYSNGKAGVLREQNSTNLRLSGAKTVDDVTNGISDAPIKSNYEQKPSLETVCLIDVDGISLDEEDSWLYKSPQEKTTQKKIALSPFAWMREDFERPSPELISTRRSLAVKLDEVAYISQAEASKNLIRQLGVIKKVTDHGDVVDAVRSVHSDASTQLVSIPTNVSQTFSTSSRQILYSSECDDDVTTKEPTWQEISLKQEQDLRSVVAIDMEKRRKASESFKRTSASEENLLSTSVGGGYRLNDMMDVKQLAKMQEESLRLSFSSPLTARKGLSKSLNRSSGALVVDDGGSPESLLEAGAFTNSLNRSSGSLMQRTRSSVGDSKQPEAVSLPLSKLNYVARHTSRSTGSLLSPNVHQPVLNGYTSPPDAGLKDGSPLPVESKTLPNRSLLSRMSRAAGMQRTVGLKAPASAMRSSSSHSPRASVAPEQLTVTRKTSVMACVPKEIGSSLPGSTQDLDQQLPSGADAHRQSMPNLSRMAPKFSLPQSSQSLRSSSQLSSVSKPTTVEAAATSRLVTSRISNSSSLRQPAKVAVPSRRPQSPTVEAVACDKSTNVSSPVQTTRPNNSMPRPATRMVTPSKTRIPSPNGRRPLVSAATAMASNDDSWKDGCF